MSKPGKDKIQQLQKKLEIAEQDNSELKDRLQNTEDKMEHFIQAVEKGPVVVVITDTTGKITYVNPKFVLLTGYTEQEVLGKKPSILKSGETSNEVYNNLWSTIQQGKTWTGVLHNRKKNGELFWERATISPVLNQVGKITHYIAVKEDISALREAESQLEEGRLRNFHQSKMAEIGLLTASILHEVGNPIAAIRGMVSNLLENVDMDDTQTCHKRQSIIDSLHLILQNTDRLIGITHDIADFTSPQADGRTLFDLNATVRSACKLIKFDKRLRDTQLTLELDPQMPALLGYKSQLTHLVLNLLINAADAVHSTEIPAPSISVITANTGDHLLLSMTDNGCGMDEEVQQHAFDAFYTTKEPGRGTGLGLSLSASIVKTHDGSIEINSRPGHGTEIRVLLPKSTTDIIDWNI